MTLVTPVAPSDYAVEMVLMRRVSPMVLRQGLVKVRVEG